jgi:hypothetical protein
VLGLLFGITFGVATAALAGARRTEDSLPRYLAASGTIHAAVLANDPAFDAATRDEVAALPDVTAAYPFMVPFALEVLQPRHVETSLIPTSPASIKTMVGVLLDGRLPDPARADEIVVNQSLERAAGLHIGSTMTVSQSVPAEARAAFPPAIVPDGDVNFRARLHVVGIAKSIDNETDWVPSSGFFAKYAGKLAGVVNMFVALRHGETGFTKFQSDVTTVVGHPVNVVRGSELLGLTKISSITSVERDGLLLFALAVILGGVVLAGQALVRAVTAGAADLATWRAMGADRRMAAGALVVPAALTAVVGAATALAVAVVLSDRFPIGLARRLDLDVGTHADWIVLGLGVLALVFVVMAMAIATAQWRVARGDADAKPAKPSGEWTFRAHLSPALLIGSRLAVEPGRGTRAVPVRSALVGVIAGVIGVVGCFTFRAGLIDTASTPSRTGIVWNYFVTSDPGDLPGNVVTSIVDDRDVGAALRARWARAVPIDGQPTPMFGTSRVKGSMSLVVLRGHAPRSSDEIAFGPGTLSELKLDIGDRVTVGAAPGRQARVVGTALLPATSHTDYDHSAWMTDAGLRTALGTADASPNDITDIVLIRWRAGAPVAAATHRIAGLADNQTVFALPATLPSAVVELGKLRSLPIALTIFFALLATATVGHALVTTVRRRRYDLAILRSIGFTRRQARIAITWQATLLTIVGLVVGIPLGIVFGRLVWRWLAESFPVAYVPPLALAAMLIVVPIAIILASILAAPPAHAATRIRPAQALRTE